MPEKRWRGARISTEGEEEEALSSLNSPVLLNAARPALGARHCMVVGGAAAEGAGCRATRPLFRRRAREDLSRGGGRD